MLSQVAATAPGMMALHNTGKWQLEIGLGDPSAFHFCFTHHWVSVMYWQFLHLHTYMSTLSFTMLRGLSNFVPYYSSVIVRMKIIYCNICHLSYHSCNFSVDSSMAWLCFCVYLCVRVHWCLVAWPVGSPGRRQSSVHPKVMACLTHRQVCTQGQLTVQHNPETIKNI